MSSNNFHEACNWIPSCAKLFLIIDFINKINTKYCPLEFYICYSKASEQKEKQILCLSALRTSFTVKITVLLQVLFARCGTRDTMFKQQTESGNRKKTQSDQFAVTLAGSCSNPWYPRREQQGNQAGAQGRTALCGDIHKGWGPAGLWHWTSQCCQCLATRLCHSPAAKDGHSQPQRAAECQKWDRSPLTRESKTLVMIPLHSCSIQCLSSTLSLVTFTLSVRTQNYVFPATDFSLYSKAEIGYKLVLMPQVYLLCFSDSVLL